jgi:pyruvate,water dikinase
MDRARSSLVVSQLAAKVIGMCEIPANVILAEEFLDILDGYSFPRLSPVLLALCRFSIGSNDLTQLVLGVDRNSEIVAPLFDERNEAVTRMISQVIQVCTIAGCSC